MNAVDAVMAAVLLALRSSPAVCASIDEDIDTEAVPEGTTELVNVRHETSSPVNRAAIRGNPIEWQTDIVVEAYARGDSPQAGTGRASRALQAIVYERLLSDPGLNGVAIDLLPGPIGTDSDRVDRRLGCCAATYTVVHRTQSATLDAV